MSSACRGCGVVVIRGAGVFVLLAMAISAGAAPPDEPARRVIPFVKQYTPGPGTVALRAVVIEAKADELGRAAAALRAGLAELHIQVGAAGQPVRLEVADVQFPEIRSKYSESIVSQGYRLRVTPTEIVIQARAPQGVFYGVQTLLQLIGPNQAVQEADLLDWPDLSYRMVMIDSARQNENADYYRQVIRLLARYKVNVLHWHLTDDENLALYHEDYPTLMHPRAWRVEQIQPLVEFAQAHYIDVVPEIESLGHARVFTRHPSFREILHQTAADKPTKSWAGTDVPGFTNVLCPASDQTYLFLERMYARAAAAFPYALLHVGCDEVEEVSCARCAAAFPNDTFDAWIVRHLRRCLDLVTRQDRKLAMWGDMLLHHPAAADELPRERVVIFDWHYRRQVDPNSAQFFKEKGFEVIGCPALFSHPRMILPDDENLQNIQAFARVARELDLRGLDTTIWTPTRYMSNVLWPGIAYAACQPWTGFEWDDDAFYAAFGRDFFGTPDGAAFGKAWRDACAMRWWLDEFYPACWIDEESLHQATEMVAKRAADVQALLARLEQVGAQLEKLTAGVQRNPLAWEVIRQSVATRVYTMKHLLAAPDVKRAGQWNVELVRTLDADCMQALTWIEADWDRTRFADDGNKDGAYLNKQNLSHRFRQMHAFHKRILEADVSTQP